MITIKVLILAVLNILYGMPERMERLRIRASRFSCFFITELFNVGIPGLFSLVCLIGYVVVQQLKIIIRFKNGTDDINLLLFNSNIYVAHRVSEALL